MFSRAVAKVGSALELSAPLTITMCYFPSQEESFLEAVLVIFLRRLGQERLSDRLFYCLRELVGNAERANAKRAYFKEKNLDINNPEDYLKGMETFREESLARIDYYRALQESMGLYIKISFQVSGGTLHISVRNNSLPTKKEMSRIREKIARAHKYDDMGSALLDVVDNEEGAGLGIIILIIMLQKTGLSEKDFKFYCRKDEAVASLRIPTSKVMIEDMKDLMEQVTTAIDQLPHSPAVVVKVQELLAAESPVEDIVQVIQANPLFATELLQVTRHLKFPGRQTLPEDIPSLIRLIGPRGMANLLYFYETEKVFCLTSKPDIWEHTLRVSFYSSYIGDKMGFSKEPLGDIYVGGLLHDIGKVLFSKLYPSLLEKIEHYSLTKKIPSELFESLSGGVNHSQLGTAIAKQWQFSETLIAIITNYHSPEKIPSKYRDVGYTIYLGHLLASWEKLDVDFHLINKEVLDHFKIPDCKTLKSFLQECREAFREAS